MTTRVQKLDVNAALEYIETAQKKGRSFNEAFSDYLASRGFSRPEEEEAFLRKFQKENRELSERIIANLEQIQKIARTAQQKYAGA